MKVQSLTDKLNPLRAVLSGSDLARSSSNAELHFHYPFYNPGFLLNQI